MDAPRTPPRENTVENQDPNPRGSYDKIVSTPFQFTRAINSLIRKKRQERGFCTPPRVRRFMEISSERKCPGAPKKNRVYRTPNARKQRVNEVCSPINRQLVRVGSKLYRVHRVPKDVILFPWLGGHNIVK